MGDKDRVFWKALEEGDVIVMCEMWVKEKRWKRVREKLPSGFMWQMLAAKRKNKKGRAMGRMVMEISRELAEVEKEHGWREKEGIIVEDFRGICE